MKQKSTSIKKTEQEPIGTRPGLENHLDWYDRSIKETDKKNERYYLLILVFLGFLLLYILVDYNWLSIAGKLLDFVIS